MRRCLGILLIVGLVLAPAAGAKGPHAVLFSGGERIEPARPWHASVELIEFGQRLPRPVLIARKGERRIAVRGSRGGARYGFRVVFPAAGRWRLTLLDGKRRFVFPAVSVGTGDVPLDYVAFPQGSMAERQGRAVFTTSRPSRWAAAAKARSAGDRLAGGALHRRRLPVVGPPGGRSRTGRGGNRHRARPRIAACEY